MCARWQQELRKLSGKGWMVPGGFGKSALIEQSASLPQKLLRRILLRCAARERKAEGKRQAGGKKRERTCRINWHRQPLLKRYYVFG